VLAGTTVYYLVQRRGTCYIADCRTYYVPAYVGAPSLLAFFAFTSTSRYYHSIHLTSLWLVAHSHPCF